MEEISKKRGRPAKNIPRKNQIVIRLSDEELATLKKNCELTGKSQAEYMREGMRMNFNLSKYDANNDNYYEEIDDYYELL